MKKTIADTGKIILCPNCGGIGTLRKNVRVNLYETETIEETCRYCQGDGRVVEKTIVTHKSLGE